MIMYIYRENNKKAILAYSCALLHIFGELFDTVCLFPIQGANLLERWDGREGRLFQSRTINENT
jgi:hypothetical protein